MRRLVLLTTLLCLVAFAGLAAASPAVKKRCHPSYKGACLDPRASDYDCLGGSGNGPRYTGRVRVVGPDVFRLDADGDGWGCEQNAVPFGFRKSFTLAPGLRLNVGRRSAGLSAGPRGAKLSANSRGRRGASLSWRGLFWRKRL